MKNTTKLIATGLCLTLPLSFISCKEAQESVTEAVTEKAEGAISEVKEKVEEMADAVPTGADGVASIFDKINTQLEGVTDLETAKKAAPALEKAGAMLKKGIEAIGGEEKMEAALSSSPELKEKFGATMITLMGHMQRIRTASPEASEFIDNKMTEIMK